MVLVTPIIFLDMDGVIANFMEPALALVFGDSAKERFADWPKGAYDPWPKLGTTETEFWAIIDGAGSDFWASLPAYSWTNKLIIGLQELGTVIVLSSPSRNPNCVAGKLQWLHNAFGYEFRNYIFAPAKHKQLLAQPNRYLIDDAEHNVNRFINNGGGGAVLVPQRWNCGHEVQDAEMADYIIGQLVHLRLDSPNEHA
jgi:hypothetical protein